jgi:uncharacterized membrane-anchored protein
MHGFETSVNRSNISKWLLITWASSLFVAVAVPVQAAGEHPEPSKADIQRIQLYQSIQWQQGPCDARLGTIAQIKVPKGCRFTAAAGAAKWIEATHNVPDPSVLGILEPIDGESQWTVVFSYEDSGHVPDDEKANLDADAILKSLREGAEEANNYRRNKGWEAVELIGWKAPPAYDEETHNLVWALRNRVVGARDEEIDYNTRILGRTGVMSAQLLVSAEEFEAAVPEAKKLLEGFGYLSGSKYSEWRAGDKVAQYGLTGLITGGLVVAAAKSGLLAKLGVLIAKFAKPIIIGIIALGAGIAKFFRNIFGGRSKA